MALPAGRYGVTKNQLLKIKKLPMNTIKLIEEIQEELDTFGTAVTHDATSVVTQSTDLVESGAVYDALVDTVGWLSNNKYDGGDVTLEKSASSSSVTHELKGGFVAGKKYKLRFNISAISGFELATTLRVQIYKTGSTATKILPIYQITQTVGIQIIEFIAESTQTDTTIQLYIQSAETGESATVTFTDISVTQISVDEQKADNSVIGTVEDGTNPTKSYAIGEHMTRGGKFCTVTSPVTTSSTWTLGSNYVEGDIASVLVYKPGDSIVISDDSTYQIPIEGYFTSAGKAIFAFIRCNKPLSGVTGISFSSGSKIYVRGTSGYILNGTLLNTLAISAIKIVPTGILVVFGKTDETAFNETDSNKAVNIALLNCTVTLS